MEISFVAIPALREALVLERSRRTGRGWAWYLDPPGTERFDLGHRLLAAERLKGPAQRRAEAAMLRYPALRSPLPPPPAWPSGDSDSVCDWTQRMHDHHVARVLAASAWVGRGRSNAVPVSRAERRREVEELRRNY